MKFELVTQEKIATKIADRLTRLLQEQKITWFLSGGSNIFIEVATLKSIPDSLLPKLTILLIDERFGQVGHGDSNWAQLEKAGFMIDGPVYVAPFTEDETTLETAVARFEAILAEIFNDDSYTFAQLGMGGDGHVSGILPQSSAARETQKLVYGYEGGGYQRLTTTFPALKMLDEIILVAYGESKWPYLEKLTKKHDRFYEPAQIIKDARRATVYTDYRQT